MALSASTLKWLRVYSYLVAIAMLVPFVVVAVAASTSGGFVQIPPKHWGLVWYGRAIHDPIFRSAVAYTVKTSLVVALIATVVGTMGAIGLQRSRFRGRSVIHAAVMSPLLIPHVIIAIGLLQLFSSLKLQRAPYGLVLGQTVIALPFVIRLVMAGLSGVSRNLEHAAHSLGASSLYVWRRVLIPLAAPSIVAGAVIAFLIAFDEATVALFMSTPDKETISVQIFNYTEQQSDPLVSAVSTILILLAVVVVIVLERSFGLLRILSGGQLDTREATKLRRFRPSRLQEGGS